VVLVSVGRAPPDGGDRSRNHQRGGRPGIRRGRSGHHDDCPTRRVRRW
jgi:hypothetical protein